MDTAYWDLFWTTGLPEAWLMSRDRPEAAARGAGPEAECPKGAVVSAAKAQPGLTGGVSAVPQR